MTGNKYLAIWSGLLLIASSIVEFVNEIIYGYLENYEYYDFFYWIVVALIAGVGITLLVGRINRGTVVLMGMYTVYTIINMIRWFSLSSILSAIEMILLLFCCITVKSKNVKLAKVISFVPVGIFALDTIIHFSFSYWLIWDVLVVAAYALFALHINSIRSTL